MKRLWLLLLATTACADQPIMSEVPRWSGGYGVQVFQEIRRSDDLFDGSDKAPNPDDAWVERRFTHLEAVYTFERWIRVTAKLPWVEQERRIRTASGVEHQSASGFDDFVLAMPIRRYKNRRGQSGHIGITPQLRMALTDDDVGDYPITDGSTDFGTSIGFERETVRSKVHLDVTYWWENAKSAGDELYVDFGLGWNFHDRGALHWETEYVEERGHYSWAGTGPSFFWNFNDTLMGRIEYKFPIHQRVDGVGLGRGHIFRVGLGVVF